MKVVWSVPAMAHFARLVGAALGWPVMLGAYTGECDKVVIVGMFDPPTYNFTLDCTKKARERVIFWCGTDVELLQDASVLPEATHLCDSEALKRELWEKGIDAKVAMLPTSQHFEVTPLPAGPIVAVYLGSDPEKYGNSIVMALADAMPDVQFRTYLYGQYTSEQMPQVVAAARVYLRLTKHDGSAQSAREFMEAGRRAIVTHDLPFAKKVHRDDLREIASAIRKALKESEPDTEAAEYWNRANDADVWLAEVSDELA